MTPQEIADHKMKWKPLSWNLFIDPDADVWAKNYAKRNFEKQSWGFQPYARQDDWHVMQFEHHSDFCSFKEAYEERFTKK